VIHTRAVGSISRSWELGKISWRVLRSDRSLAWFPVLSLIGTLLVLAVFGGLIAATGVEDHRNAESLKGIGYVFIVLAYIGLAFVTMYFLGALVHAANERLSGRDASVGDSLSAANSKIHRLLPFAIVQATVSMILNALERNSGWVGDLIAALLGTAWSVLTFLTAPVIMLEDLGPFAALKRSGQLLRKTWGENIVAQTGFGLLGFFAMLPAFLVFALVASSGSTALAVTFGIVAAIWVAVVVVVISAMSGIYRTALYRFVVDGQAPPAFQDVDLGDAFTPRERRGFFG
jgi:hypothetical protein